MRGLPASVKLLGFAAFLAVLYLSIAPLASDKPRNATDADAKVESVVHGFLPCETVVAGWAFAAGEVAAGAAVFAASAP